MAAITWRNIEQLNNSGANRLISSGFDRLSSEATGLKSISDGLQKRAAFEKAQSEQNAASAAIGNVLAAQNAGDIDTTALQSGGLGDQFAKVAQAVQQRQSFLQGKANDEVANEGIRVRTEGGRNQNIITAAEAGNVFNKIDQGNRKRNADINASEVATEYVPKNFEQRAELAIAKNLVSSNNNIRNNATSASNNKRNNETSVSNNAATNSNNTKNAKLALNSGQANVLDIFKDRVSIIETKSNQTASTKQKRDIWNSIAGANPNNSGLQKYVTRNLEALKDGTPKAGVLGDTNVKGLLHTGLNKDSKDAATNAFSHLKVGSKMNIDGDIVVVDKELLSTLGRHVVDISSAHGQASFNIFDLDKQGVENDAVELLKASGYKTKKDLIKVKDTTPANVSETAKQLEAAAKKVTQPTDFR